MDRRAAIRSYAEFWLFYLGEHRRPATRALHFAGTGIAIVLIASGLAAWSAWPLVLAVFAGYGPAWLAHFAVEKNQPATFRYPLWSLLSDFRMLGMWLLGHLEREYDRFGIPAR